jgi:4a-hydroxytetrahydrobiopterin dehydratase
MSGEAQPFGHDGERNIDGLARRARRVSASAMARPSKLSEAEVKGRLAERPAWKLVDGKLHRELAFVDFVTAFSFMSGAALVAERLNHHPEWFNVYGTVRIDLNTHDVSGISELDFELAAALDDLAKRHPQK